MIQEQVRCPVQQPMRHQTRPAAMIKKQTPKKRPAGCSCVLKPQRMTAVSPIAIKKPAAASAGLMPVIARKIGINTVNVKENRL